MFFRRIELRETRPLNARLPIVSARGNLLLLHTILHDPYFRAVFVGSVANHHDLEDRIIRREINLVVQLSDKRTKFLKECNTDGLQVRFAFAGRSLIMGVAAADTLEITVQPDGLGVGGNAPFRSSEEDADVRGVEIHHAGRNAGRVYG